MLKNKFLQHVVVLVSIFILPAVAQGALGDLFLLSVVPYYSESGVIKGGGAVSGAGIDCSFVDGGEITGNCSVLIDEGAQVVLAAAPDVNSTFAGWGGGCSGSDACAFTIVSNTVVNSFFASAYRVMDNDGRGYDTLTDALSGAGNEIYARQRFNTTTLAEEAYSEDVVVTRTVTIKGGYTAGFDGNTGLYSILEGVLTIGDGGSLTVENIVIK